jgi:hypothetical protein
MFTFMQPVSEDITKDKYFLHGESQWKRCLKV